jgi:hypothetical protein
MTIATHAANKIKAEEQQEIKLSYQFPDNETRIGPYDVWIHVSTSSDIRELCDYIGYPHSGVNGIIARQHNGDYAEVWISRGAPEYLDSSKYRLVFRQ